MKRITKNLLANWQYVGGLFLLFLVELYCIAGISDSVYRMRNTGAESSGIQYMAADALTQDAWQRAELYMSDSEKALWNDCYEKKEDGLYYLDDRYKSSDSMSELEEKFRVPQAVVWKLSVMDQKELDDFLEENGGLERTDYLEIRDLLEEQLEKAGNQETDSCAMAFVREQSEAAGVDLVEKKTRYLSGTVFLIILYLMFFAASAVGSVYLAGLIQRLIGKWIQEPEMRGAEQMLLYTTCMAFDALMVYITALYRLKQLHAAAGWYAAGFIILAVLPAAAGVIRIRPEFEKIREKLAFTERRQRRFLKNMSTAVFVGIPLALLIAGCMSVLSPCLADFLFLMAADLAVAAGAFWLPDIMEAADCVDETFAGDDGEDW
ncbi:MAG: hypothetical protein PUG60_03020 [Lachnospiraceae bacterium]|nr:hypothetical protein [Lachnospiraceae bacterium]MDY4971335.1 hypothetical protein [Lachnospiraceae bacterium]